MGAELFPCGQTDMTELTVAFRNFAYAPKNKVIMCCKVSVDARTLPKDTLDMFFYF